MKIIQVFLEIRNIANLQVIQYEYVPTDLETTGVVIYAADSAEGAFIEFLKSYRLA